jgi:hypothetical protein
VIDSTTNVEYMAALEVANEGICVKKFVIKLGVVPSGYYREDLLCDNSVNILLAKGTKVSPKDKIYTQTISFENE